MTRIVSMRKCSEDELDILALKHVLSSATLLIETNVGLLLGFNTWRKQWEVPSGHIEPGETPRVAVKRELFEETHQRVSDIQCVGVVLVKDKDKVEHYRVIYRGELSTVNKFVYDPQSDENSRIKFFNDDELANSAERFDTDDLRIAEAFK